ncbi:methyltransferase domain-containing protein [Hyaloraphidium curvatum]|nr:methyltransferase domain-containing protein [Hyaloraphidium curvatum]
MEAPRPAAPSESFVRLPARFALEGVRATDGLVSAARFYVEAALQFATTRSGIFDFPTVDFFLRQPHFGSEGGPPAEWAVLGGETTAGLAALASGQGNEGTRSEWPASLKSFIEDCRELSLPKRLPDRKLFGRTELPPWEANRELFRGMSAKKRRECELLAPLVASEAAGKVVVDLGCGQGYLTSVLAFGYGMEAIGIDGQAVQKEGADRRAGRLSKDGNGRARFFRRTVSSADELESLLEECGEDGVDGRKCCIVGLHTCGDLAPTVLKLFKSSSAESCVFVGCCYNLLTRHGFPMSDFVRELDRKLAGVTYNAMQVACQNADGWQEGQEAELDMVFNRLFFRAVLQVLLVENDLICSAFNPRCDFASPGAADGADTLSPIPSRNCVAHPSRTMALGRFRSQSSFSSFNAYVETALKRLGHAGTLSADSIASALARFQGRRGELAAAWTLRTMMAGAIEGIVLIDRWLWCAEMGIACRCGPGWEPGESPRNWVYVCRKTAQPASCHLE